MKFLFPLFLSVFLTFSGFAANASDWELLPYSIGTVLDQTETDGALYLLSLEEIHQNPEPNSPTSGSFSIHRFDGTTMSLVVEFDCVSPNEIFEMNIQSFQDKLYIGGGFHSLNGDTSMNYFTCYENGSFHQVAGGMKEVSNGCVRDLDLYNGTLLVAGRYRLASVSYESYHCDFLVSFTGSGWVKFGNEDFSYWCYVTCLVSKITLDGNDLIIVGEFDRIGNLQLNSVARYHLGNWYAMTNSLHYAWSPGVVANGGSFYTIRNEYSEVFNTPTLCFLDKWDGTSWQSVRQISSGVMSKSLVSFNDQLFVSGSFSDEDPSMAEVCTLDTTTGVMTSSFDIDCYNVLFRPGTLFEFQSTLYCASAYLGYYGIETSSLAVYKKGAATATTATVSNIEAETDLISYPNPASGSLYLKGDLQELGAVQILDITGKVKLDFPEGYSDKLSIESLSAGAYILKIEKKGNYVYRNFIKN